LSWAAATALHSLEALTHLFGPIQELLPRNLSVRDVQLTRDHIEHELLALIGDIGPGDCVLAAGQLVPPLRGIQVHHAAEPASSTASAALEAASSTLEAAATASILAASTRSTTAGLLTELRKCAGRTDQ
jgi:hypothetical protein